MNNESVLHLTQFDPDTVLFRQQADPDRDTGQRSIWLSEPIATATACKLVDTLLRFESAAPGVPIHLYIHSPGGCVVSGLAIVNTMQHISSPVFTYAVGMAASMAAVVLAAGQKEHRYVLSGSFVMIHQPSAGAGGTMENLRATLAFQSQLEASSNRILARCSGRTIGEIEEVCRVDKWMDARAAKDFGLVDHILEHHPDKL